MRTASLLALPLAASSALGLDFGLRARKPGALQARKERAAARLERSELDQDKDLSKRWTNSTGGPWRYESDKTEEYIVSSLPDVPYDLGEFYSGLMPIEAGNDSRALFFVFQPTVGEQVDEVTIWLNGGPGCSSLEGFIQENGRFLWQYGLPSPLDNPYSWVNLTNMLWVEHPVGTGFSIGDVTADTEEEISQDFVKFFKNFQDTFGIKNYKIFVTGESYAGRYVPYISAAMIDANDTEYYDLQGALVYDPCIGEFDYVQNEAVTWPLVEKNKEIFNFNETFMATLEDLHQSCGYKDFVDQYLAYPASGIQPPTSFNYSDSKDAACDVYNMAFEAAITVNPCFDVYAINTPCPILWDVLGFSASLEYQAPGAPEIYFNRSDVKAAMHAPDYVDWGSCSANPVFTGGDQGPQGEGDLSADPIQYVLPKVVEHTNRVLVSNGDYDMSILTDGTLLAIQNMTWNGQLGFQSKPNASFVVDLPELLYLDVFEANGFDGGVGPQGVMGISHYERGLMWVETFQSGHMQPQYQGRVAYKQLQWLLGRIDEL